MRQGDYARESFAATLLVERLRGVTAADIQAVRAPFQEREIEPCRIGPIKSQTVQRYIEGYKIEK